MSPPRTQAEQIVLATLFSHPTTRLKDETAFRQWVESAEITALVEQFKHSLLCAMEQHRGLIRKSPMADDPPQLADEDLHTDLGTGLDSATPPVETQPEEVMEPKLTESALQPGEIPAAIAAPTTLREPTIRTLKLSIPNGLSGQDYATDLLELCPELQTCIDIRLQDNADTGLALESPARLAGKLSTAGSHQLRVTAEDPDGLSSIELLLKLAIIPNSRDLWKHLPADPSAPYAKPEADVRRIAAQPGWQLTMASQRGRSHAHKGTHRDDHGTIMHTADGWNLIVIADGAGSCRYSREGSRLAAEHASLMLGHQLNQYGYSLEATLTRWWLEDDRSILPQSVIEPLSRTIIPAVYEAYTAITREADRSGLPIKDFSTTLLLAAHTLTEHGHLVVSFGIGDGAIALLRDASTVKLMNHPDSGKHVGQTRFLDKALFMDAQGLYRRIQVQLTPSLEALLLATDGVTDPKFDSDNQMHDARAWWKLFSELKPVLPGVVQATQQDPLLDYLDFFIERHHDDRTLAILHRTESDTVDRLSVSREDDHE